MTHPWENAYITALVALLRTNGTEFYKIEDRYCLPLGWYDCALFVDNGTPVLRMYSAWDSAENKIIGLYGCPDVDTQLVGDLLASISSPQGGA